MPHSPREYKIQLVNTAKLLLFSHKDALFTCLLIKQILEEKRIDCFQWGGKEKQTQWMVEAINNTQQSIQNQVNSFRRRRKSTLNVNGAFMIEKPKECKYKSWELLGFRFLKCCTRNQIKYSELIFCLIICLVSIVDFPNIFWYLIKYLNKQDKSENKYSHKHILSYLQNYLWDNTWNITF